MKQYWMIMLISLLAGCTQQEAPTMVDGVEVRDVPQDPPAFERVYVESISDNVTVRITMKSYSFGRSDRFGELQQSDGKYVLFNIGRVAEKIIQAELVPHVERAVQHVLALDAAYMKSKPASFVDVHGTRWVRAD